MNELTRARLTVTLHGGEDYYIYDGIRLVAIVYAEQDLRWLLDRDADLTAMLASMAPPLISYTPACDEHGLFKGMIAATDAAYPYYLAEDVDRLMVNLTAKLAAGEQERNKYLVEREQVLAWRRADEEMIKGQTEQLAAMQEEVGRLRDEKKRILVMAGDLMTQIEGWSHSGAMLGGDSAYQACLAIEGRIAEWQTFEAQQALTPKVTPDPLRQACEKFAVTIDETMAKAVTTHGGMTIDQLTDMVLAFAKAQRAAGVREVMLRMGIESGVSTIMNRIYKWCEQRIKELK